MIPKTIHYCWFGKGTKPKLAQRCLSSWKKYCPEYDIIEWNEDNYNVDSNIYTQYCYNNKRWAFVSDYARLAIVLQYGGIYLDTDVELVRPIDELLKYKAFFGFENNEHVASGIGFGAEAHNSVVEKMLLEYNELPESQYGTIGCPILNTRALNKIGLALNGEKQIVENACILPVDYFNPYDDPTGKLNVTKNTYSIHWYAKSWLSKRLIIRSKFTRPFHCIFGKNCFEWTKR